MHKIMLPLIMILSLSTQLYAQFSSTPVFSTVESVRSMWDGSAVILEGYLIEQLEDTMYLFKDSTGRIEVAISDFKFSSIEQKIQVKLRGTIDVLWPSKSRRINVDFVEIIVQENSDDDDITNAEDECVCEE